MASNALDLTALLRWPAARWTSRCVAAMSGSALGLGTLLFGNALGLGALLSNSALGLGALLSNSALGLGALLRC
jgi:hypothetical protein